MLEQKDIEYGQFADEFKVKLVDYKAYDMNKARNEPQAELIQLMRYHLHAEF